jgi:hypothetical protein
MWAVLNCDEKERDFLFEVRLLMIPLFSMGMGYAYVRLRVWLWGWGGGCLFLCVRVSRGISNGALGVGENMANDDHEIRHSDIA